jgi:hypothetical protein
VTLFSLCRLIGFIDLNIKGPRDYSDLDPPIAPLVAMMNRVGFQTYASCAGHGIPVLGMRSPYIAFRCHEFEKVRALASCVRQDGLSDNPKLRWSWEVNASFNSEMELTFSLVRNRPRSVVSPYWNPHKLSDFETIYGYLSSCEAFKSN